jgi:hypothetical protein
MICGPAAELVCRKMRWGGIAGRNVSVRNKAAICEPRKRRKTEESLGAEQESYGLLVEWFVGPQLN